LGLLPLGNITMLFTDIEGSTRLLEQLGDEPYEWVLAECQRIIREAVAGFGGVEVSTEGDAFFVAFADAESALATAVAAQRALASFSWGTSSAVRVRMGIHTGPVRLVGDDYVGLAVHQAVRICAAGHGGQVVVSEATGTAAGTLPAGLSLRALGRHRLKDLGAPLELFQLCGEGLAADFAPLRTLERVRHNLPIIASSLVGRVDELALGAKLLTSTRMLCITGPGGTGKTRVAYQLAADMLDEFEDGVWVVELAAVADSDLVPAAMMAALGLGDEAGRTTLESIVDGLRARRALVVMDNCEHLIDAAATLVAALLADCPKVQVLATSREPLRVVGETVWSLPTLAVPDDPGLPLDELRAADAAGLFCERASEATAGFALSPDNAAAVLAVCARLEGIPLGIELGPPESARWEWPASPSASPTAWTCCPMARGVPSIVRPAWRAPSPGPTAGVYKGLCEEVVHHKSGLAL